MSGLKTLSFPTAIVPYSSYLFRVGRITRLVGRQNLVYKRLLEWRCRAISGWSYVRSKSKSTFYSTGCRLLFDNGDED